MFDFTDVATVTRSLVKSFRHHDPKGENVKITCAILEEDRGIEKVQLDEAKLHNVILRGAVQPTGESVMIRKIVLVVHELPKITLGCVKKETGVKEHVIPQNNSKQIAFMVGRKEFGYNEIDLKLAIDATMSVAENI